MSWKNVPPNEGGGRGRHVLLRVAGRPLCALRRAGAEWQVDLLLACGTEARRSTYAGHLSEAQARARAEADLRTMGWEV